VPLAPYITFGRVEAALPVSVALTMVALFVFGVVKSRFTGVPALRGGSQMLLTGGLAAAAAFVIARAFG
jgi:VIT1/CCC1 family predicted Fe2+/Mn2+ transporter